MTALARPDLLERVSEVVAPQQRSGDHSDIDLTALSAVDHRRLSNLLARLATLAEAAAKVGLLPKPSPWVPQRYTLRHGRLAEPRLDCCSEVPTRRTSPHKH